jgi:hypothetical protein
MDLVGVRASPSKRVAAGVVMQADYAGQDGAGDVSFLVERDECEPLP